MPLKAPATLDAKGVWIIFLDGLIFFHGLPGDHKPASHETVKILKLKLLGSVAMVNTNCFLINKGLPLNTFGFIHKRLQLWRISGRWQLFAGLLLKIVGYQDLNGCLRIKTAFASDTPQTALPLSGYGNWVVPLRQLGTLELSC